MSKIKPTDIIAAASAAATGLACTMAVRSESLSSAAVYGAAAGVTAVSTIVALRGENE
jgi:hypothetical protein